MVETLLRPRAGRSAKALLLTMLGEFVLPAGGSVWTSTVIDGLGLLGVGERNARQAAARLADQGLIESERVGRSARWRLTESGRELLEDGTLRIDAFGTAGADWDGRWLVVLASGADGDRASRQQLRARLGFAGFGFLNAGTAVSPHPDREALANDVLASLDPSAIVFVATTGSFVPDREIIGRAWDLDGLASDYRGFVAEFEALAPSDPAACFAARALLVHEWRRFPFADPEIPDELLPADWPGRSAKVLFDDRRGRWSDRAVAWFDGAEERSTSS